MSARDHRESAPERMASERLRRKIVPSFLFEVWRWPMEMPMAGVVQRRPNGEGERERGACCRRALDPHEMETRAWAEFSLLCLLGLSGYVHSGFLAFETPDKI